MAITLAKGQGVSLQKEAPNLNRLLVGLGWDPVDQPREKAKKGDVRGRLRDFGTGMRGFLANQGVGGGQAQWDLDASIICIDQNGHHESTVYYGEKTHRSGAIKHHGDNLTGAGEGDDEQIEIILDKVPANISKLAIIINIYSAAERHQDFGRVRNCFVHATDMDSGKELVRYDVDGNFDGKTGLFVADVYRHNGEWKFKAIGEGANVSGIRDMVAMKCR